MGLEMVRRTCGAMAMSVGMVAASATPAIVAAEPVASPSIAVESSPAWLTPRDLPQPTQEQLQHVSDGTIYLLTDWQVRGNSTGHDSYYRFASKIADRSGLESAGQITLSFDPRVEAVALNFVHVIRDGAVIDRTGEVRFAIVEREPDLDDGIISGNLQAIANLKDIRVGDVVDYATTTHARSPLWPGHYFSNFIDRYSDPLGFRGIRILWPASRPLNIKARNSGIAFTTRDLGDLREWQWTGTKLPFGPGEQDVPAWYPQYGRIDVSTMKTWAEMAGWATALYAGDETLPPEFTARLDEIAARWPHAEDRLTETTRYVQDNIRYVGEEMGEGSYVPRRPALVIERGYGDCKDKSLLLAVALRRLGIDAVPALVSTTPGFDLSERPPSPLLFDHVIVRAVVDGRVTWIDPTATHRGGRGLRIVPSDLGYALPIRAGQATLERMETTDARAGSMDVVEKFAVDETAATALTLAVETRYSDSLADWMRARIATRGNVDIARGNLEFYQKRFPGLVESATLEMRDDRDANRLVMVEHYTLSKVEFDKGKILSELKTAAYAVNDLVPARQAAPRRNPLTVPANVSRNHTIEITARGREPWLPDPVEIEAEGITFSRKAQLNGETVRIDYRLASQGRNMVPAVDAAAVYAVSDRIDDSTDLRFFLDKSPKPTRAVSPLDLPGLAPYRSEIGRAGTLMTKGDQTSLVEALSIINRVAEQVARPSPAAGLVDGLKGVMLVGLHRPVPGRAALQSSIEQYQGNADMIRTLIALQLDARDAPAALRTLETARTSQPAVVEALDRDWVRMLSSQIHDLPRDDRQKAQEDLCITLANGRWQQQPRTAAGNGMLGCAIEAQARRGRIADARALLAENPSVETLVNLAVDKRYAGLWPDFAPQVTAGFKGAIADEVAQAAEAASRAPDDFEAATRYLRALRTAGQPERAVKAGRALADRKDRIEAIGSSAFWFVNEYAYALAESGRVDEAIARMDGLIALGVDSYPDLVSQVINRAQMLNLWDRSALALPAFVEADEKFAGHASLFGRMWIWSGAACALHDLGRGAEARVYQDKLAQKPEENVAAVTLAAACRDDRKTIEAQLLARLDDPEKRGGVLEGFIRFDAPGATSRFQTRIRQAMAAVRATPAVQDKFRNYGRAVTFAGVPTYWGGF